MTPLQRWRRRRDLVIGLAHASGASQRILADVFDLPPSRIGQVVAELRAECGGELDPRSLRAKLDACRARPSGDSGREATEGDDGPQGDAPAPAAVRWSAAGER